MAKVLDIKSLEGEDWILVRMTRTELAGIVDANALTTGAIFRVPGEGGHEPLVTVSAVSTAVTDALDGVLDPDEAFAILSEVLTLLEAPRGLASDGEPDPNAPGGG